MPDFIPHPEVFVHIFMQLIEFIFQIGQNIITLVSRYFHLDT